MCLTKFPFPIPMHCCGRGPVSRRAAPSRDRDSRHSQTSRDKFSRNRRILSSAARSCCLYRKSVRAREPVPGSQTHVPGPERQSDAQTPDSLAREKPSTRRSECAGPCVRLRSISPDLWSAAANDRGERDPMRVVSDGGALTLCALEWHRLAPALLNRAPQLF